MLNLENVDSFYGAIQALRNVSLSVEKGEVVTIIGANGAGKSTLLKTIAGVLKPTAGSITLEGSAIVGLRPADIVRRGVSLVPEGRQVFPGLAVEDNLTLGAFTRRGQASRQELAAEMDRVYTLFPQLAERRRQPAGTLSGGEQQMLAIGRSLMARPRLILLDEPSLGLAPLLVEAIFEALYQLNQQGLTILLVEQNARLGLEIADRAYVLQTGQVVLQGTSAALLADRKVREAYLGEHREGLAYAVGDLA
ncbi:MAG: ABC transporter ATP-binding protein [Anaerolineae bacterium]